ncbi:MAG: methyltransferase domain-containing protein [bacterium]
MQTTESPRINIDNDNLEKKLPDDEAPSFDSVLYCRDYEYFVTNLENAKKDCLNLIDQSQNSDYWRQMLQTIEEEVKFNDETSWDEIMNTIFPLMHNILNHRYRDIAFMRDDETRIAEFFHRYAIYLFLESSQNEEERSERMENLLGTTQNIFVEGHHNVGQLRDRPAIVDYQNGYESFLSVLTACKTPEEIKNASIAILEVSPRVDWEVEKDDPTILGAMARHRMESGNYLEDNHFQSTNAYTESAQLSLSALIRSGATLDENDLEFLVDIAINSTETNYLSQIAELVSSSPDVAARILLSILQNPQSHEVQRHISLSLLYRIELGRIGISKDGVEYLTRKFDLGEYNDPNYSVYRGSSRGDILVFDEAGAIKGFFKLEMSDFIGDQVTIQKKLQEITIDILFTPEADETPEQRVNKLQLIEEFKNNYLNTYKELFSGDNDQIPFHFNNLSLSEQGFALKFLNSHPEDDPVRQKFFNFIEKYGEDGLRAFRSIEFDPKAGEKILEIGTHLSPIEVKRLFKEYGKTYLVAEEVAMWVKKVLIRETEQPTTRDLLEVNIIREQILLHAQDALLNPVSDGSSDISFLPGDKRLFCMHIELEKVLSIEPTIDNFELVQFILNRYFLDNLSSGEEMSVSEQVISAGLMRLYNDREGFSLSEYEGKTNNRLQSNIAVLRACEEMPSQAFTGDPEKLNIFSLGAGYGGDAYIWAALGHKVNGIDQSQRMVDDSVPMSRKFVDAYKNDINDYSVNAVKEAILMTDNVTNEEIIDQIPENIDIKMGNFFDYGPKEYQDNFGERQPDIVTIMWHTLGFAGDLEGIKKVLKNAYDILRPGGRIFIEMPDRNFGGYARAIRDFHNDHQDLPFGVIKDAPSKNADTPTEQNESLATWRYFPKNSEIEWALGNVGFDFVSVESYFVKAEASPTAKLLIKENLFVAEKPLDPERYQKKLDYFKDNLEGQVDVEQSEIERVRKQISDFNE